MRAICGLICVIAILLNMPLVHAQDGLTILDESGGVDVDAGEQVPSCGNRPVSIARMQWPSAALLAEIHALLLTELYQCQTQVLAGDMASTVSAMAGTGQPAVVPELWVTRVAEAWNAGVNDQSVRVAADSFAQTRLEGWYVPDYVAAADPGLAAVTDLAGSTAFGGAETPAEGAPSEAEESDAAPPAEDRAMFISCPPDWACAIINRNLLAAYGLSERFDVRQPENRFEMDDLIAGAVSRQEPFVAYYWAPNAILDQFAFVPLEMGAYDAEAMECLADADCLAPQPSAFVEETVVVALAEWVATDLPEIAAYFRRASMPIPVMNALLGELGTPGTTVADVAQRFVDEREDIWEEWAGSTVSE